MLSRDLIYLFMLLKAIAHYLCTRPEASPPARVADQPLSEAEWLTFTGARHYKVLKANRRNQTFLSALRFPMDSRTTPGTPPAGARIAP